METDNRPKEQVAHFHCGPGPGYGIVHTPPGPSSKWSTTGVVFVNAGVRSRRGPQRLYVRFARRLCQAGYPVWRFDPPGIGDSPGDVADPADYREKFCDSLDCNRAAISALHEAAPIERVTLFGLCGGAYGAMMTAVVDSRVAQVMLAGMPVQDLGNLTPESMSDIATQDYFTKIFQWKSWHRLISGKTNYRWLFRAMGRLATGRYRRPDLNESLLDASSRFVGNGGKALFLYGGRDPLYPPFADAYLPRLTRSADSATSCRTHLVPDANHVFSQIHWQDELIERSIRWLDEQCAATTEPEAAA